MFVFIFTTAAMSLLGLWLAWAVRTEHWDYLLVYFVCLAGLIWKLWDYREPN